ncbi:unnamed protein product [Prunus brigantina]
MNTIARKKLRCTRRKERQKGKSSPFHHRELKSRPTVVSSACEIPIAVRYEYRWLWFFLSLFSPSGLWFLIWGSKIGF